MGINKVILVGNAGRDPEVKHLDKGVAVARLTLATSETYTAQTGDRVTQTEWHTLIFWRKLAEIVEQYVKKGDKLYVEGRLRTRSWDDAAGVKHYTTEVYVDTMEMLSSKSAQSGGIGAGAPFPPAPPQAASQTTPQAQAPQYPLQAPEMEESNPEDDLPF
ncbi:MAG: single-stranded DNA-binding protein [Bacteroidales bacterium]|jgi:single-strand DNA-binding protein|nr:single-stranded DNA-binding protein [Bacteroidales bacterium]